MRHLWSLKQLFLFTCCLLRRCFAKKKKKKGWLFFFLEKEIPVLEACDKEALRRGLGSLPALPF